jgi:hypothetical protein
MTARSETTCLRSCTPRVTLSTTQCAYTQAVYVTHKIRSAVTLANMEAPSTVTVRLINYTPSDLHIRQLKSSTIGVYAAKSGACVADILTGLCHFQQGACNNSPAHPAGLFHWAAILYTTSFTITLAIACTPLS